MAQFYFRSTDKDDFHGEECALEFADSEAAITEARVAFAEMVAEGLPEGPNSVISVQVLDSTHTQIIELRLVLQIRRADFPLQF